MNHLFKIQILIIPVALRSEDFHSLWVNSTALELAGITKDTPNPPGGVIERNKAGEPSGTLRETAQNLVLSKLPSFSIQQYKEALQYFQDYANKNGYTQVNHILVKNQGNIVEALQALEKEQMLSIRHNLSFTIQPNEGENRIPYLKEQRQNLQGPFVKLNSVKLFMDGVIEGETAYLHELYNNKPDYRGVPIWEKQTYINMIQALDKERFQIHVHSIGDAAATETLDVLENAQKTNGKRDSRHKITHLQLVRERDFKRFKVGKKADLVVLDKNLFEVPEDSIYQTKILLTLLEGKEIYHYEDF